MEDGEGSQKQLIVFQSEMPDLAATKQPNGDQEIVDNREAKDSSSALSSDAPINVVHPITEAELGFEGAIHEINGDKDAVAIGENKDSPHITAISGCAPINIVRTITEAELAFKGPFQEPDGDQENVEKEIKETSQNTAMSSATPINVTRTMAEAELNSKSAFPEQEIDTASETKDTAVTSTNGDRITEAVYHNVDLDNLEVFWDGRYHQTSYIRQYDILDDGEPPPPRAGWPIQQLNLRCIVKNLEHPPLLKGPEERSYFSMELHLGDQVYKTPVCMGDATAGFIKFDQLFTAHIDDDVLESVAVSLRDGTVGPALTAVVFDCGRRFKNTVRSTCCDVILAAHCTSSLA